jgi:hypothetical protein
MDTVFAVTIGFILLQWGIADLYSGLIFKAALQKILTGKEHRHASNYTTIYIGFVWGLTLLFIFWLSYTQ